MPVLKPNLTWWKLTLKKIIPFSSSTFYYAINIYVSSRAGNQNAIFVHAEASIMYFGLNWTHWTGPGWSAFNTQTLYPVSAFQTCTLPSVEPLNMNWESGLKDASIGMPLLFRCPVNVCKGVPWKASTNLIIEPFVLIKMVLPSLENFKPVQSHSFSWVSLKVTKGPWNITKLFIFNYVYSILQIWQMTTDSWWNKGCHYTISRAKYSMSDYQSQNHIYLWQKMLRWNFLKIMHTGKPT